ncbi:MAG: MBL fold metallo-hydrolase, partial [Kiritimatiellae bacterium]|nr:MBL fold metallo-hydrolase [Kiritimatiellia bacterium]
MTFHGAAHTVTGSMHLVEANGLRILLDCGLYQGHRKEAFEKNRNLPVDAASIDAVILSHAHIDHAGNLPQLVRHGFRGKVYARPATCDLAGILLRDSCFLQQRDLLYINKRRAAQGKHLFEPLYEECDVDLLMSLFEPVPMKRIFDLGRGVNAVFHNAGHILGSAITQLDISGGHPHRILFSGDIGQPDQPILRHYECPEGADIVIMESTYADRVHPSGDDVAGRLKCFMEAICQQKAKLLIPAFSVGRTQQILYYLSRLHDARRLPNIPVYIDSPLSAKATAIYRQHRECWNDDAADLLRGGIDPLSLPNLHFVETPEESFALDRSEGPMVVIAASGMCEGGRVVHHLKAMAPDPTNIILIVGFQAEGTLGRRVVDEITPLRMLGEEVNLRARVHTINALSAHADRNGLLDWFDGVNAAKTVKHAFAVHGETDRVEMMANMLVDHGAP